MAAGFGGGGFGQSPPSTSYMGGGGNFGPAPPGKVRGQDGQLYDYRGPTDAQGLPDLSHLPGGGAIHHGGGRTTEWGAQQREDALDDPRWRDRILARQDKLKKNPWQQPTGGGMRGRGAFNNYMQNLRQPMY